uniref:RNA helicase n=1 Tax=Rhabditophanes sp. KR3021 TaxID=114890 RepID=A0AC35TV45_9BILA
MSQELNNGAQPNHVNGSVQQQQPNSGPANRGRYVPPHRRSDAIPEGAPHDGQQAHQFTPRGNYEGGGYNGGYQQQNRAPYQQNQMANGGMRKVNSFSGMQQPESGAAPADMGYANRGGYQGGRGGSYSRPPQQNYGGGSNYMGGNNRGYQQQNGQGGYAPRGGMMAPSRAQYTGRFSYDRRNTHDESQWQQRDNSQQHSGGGWNSNYGGPQQNTRWNREPDSRQVDWDKQGPVDQGLESELFAGMNSGINFNKYEEIPVEATGQDIPRPISSFSDLELHDWVQENIKKSGYDRPTPVQKYSIPTLNGKRDLMSCAQTGSGKTAAFLVPLINRILVDGPGSLMKAETRRDGKTIQYPSALIISPTRELSLQIYNESRKFAYRTPIISALLYGGRENYKDQINKLRLGVHILIATPGRLIDVIGQGFIGLDNCRYLVLDEADRMLDMGFEPQIRQIVDLNNMPKKGDRVTAMFSATFPKEIQMLAQDFLLPNYVFLAVGRVGSTSENILQKVVWCDDIDKKSLLMDLLSGGDPSALTLVFVETKKGASELAHTLCRQGYEVVAIHGDLKQLDRERHLDAFRTGQSPVLVATAVAARGLDIPNVKHVINYDLPSDVDEYVHRIGRTGRCGNTGSATSFFNDKNRNIARDLAELIVEANQELPEFLSKMSEEAARGGGKNFNNKGKGGRFGGRDHRTQYGGNGFNANGQRQQVSSYGGNGGGYNQGNGGGARGGNDNVSGG